MSGSFAQAPKEGATMSAAIEARAPVRHESGSRSAPHGIDATSTSYPGVRVAQSDADDSTTAVRALHRLLYQPYAELVMFFCSSDYDLDAVSREIGSCFAGVQVVGCTSGGGIGPLGYVEHSISGISFASGTFAAVSGRVEKLNDFDADEAEALVAVLRERLEAMRPGVPEHKLFACQAIDGMSASEEQVTRAFQSALGTIPLMGGSAGDTGPFGPTYVFERGRFHEDSAVLVIAASALPFRTFCTHHLSGTDQRGVVTAVAQCGRRVLEIDGLRAAEGYARLFDAQTADLGPRFFSSHPVVVRIGDIDYARSVGSVNVDGSLTFQCAMEEGIVLRCAVENDLVTDFMGSFAPLNRELGMPSATLLCDCVQRGAEISQLGLDERVAGILRHQNAVGFSTHGAQAGGIHVNQALLGIAFAQGNPQ
jgi:hypothetical protein